MRVHASAFWSWYSTVVRGSQLMTRNPGANTTHPYILARFMWWLQYTMCGHTGWAFIHSVPHPGLTTRVYASRTAAMPDDRDVYGPDMDAAWRRLEAVLPLALAQQHPADRLCGVPADAACGAAAPFGGVC